MVGQRIAVAPVRPAVARIGTRRRVRRAGQAGRADRFAVVGKIHQCHQRAPDAARRHPGPRGFRGQRTAGQARPRAPPDDGPHDPDEPAVRPGPGPGDRDQFRRRPDDLRTLADAAVAGRAGARLHWRGALQCAELFIEFCLDAGAPRARIHPPDRRLGGDGEGNQDIRVERFPDRALSQARRWFLRGEPPAGDQPRGMGQPADGPGHVGLLRRLRLHRMAHGARRIHHRRPDLPGRIVSPPAQFAGRFAERLFRRGRAGAVPRGPVFVLRDRTRNRLTEKPPSVSDADPTRIRFRGCRLPVSRRRSLGGAPSGFHPEGRRSAGAGRRERCRQDHVGEIAGAALRPG